MNPDKPFVLHGGATQEAALHNRIAAIERIKFLTSGIDLRKKNQFYLCAFDLEMWQRWYKKEPLDKKIDEEWCQRAAEVVKGMEGKDVVLNGNELEQAVKEHKDKLQGVVHADPDVKSNPAGAGETGQDQR
jgi:hypothetical protein